MNSSINLHLVVSAGQEGTIWRRWKPRPERTEGAASVASSNRLPVPDIEATNQECQTENPSLSCRVRPGRVVFQVGTDQR